MNCSICCRGPLQRPACLFVLFIGLMFSVYPVVASEQGDAKLRFVVVSSYHPGYGWSLLTNEGVIQGLLEFGYLDDRSQAESYTRNNYVESSKAVVKKLWMDTKRKNKKSEMARTLARVVEEIDHFKPDIILLGDDNAVNYVGNHYIDSEVPVVFWGVNGKPVKYGLLDSVERPGHNVTGVYQQGYHHQTLRRMKQLLPELKTFALIVDNTPTGRAHSKRVQRFHENGEVPLALVETVVTNSFSEWQSRLLALQDQVDSFYLGTHHALRDDAGNHVSHRDAMAWYRENIKKPEGTTTRTHVVNGFLCSVDDSGIAQGYEAMKMAHDILHKGKDPAVMSAYYPPPGPFVVNRERALALGLGDLLESHGGIIDEVIENAK